MKDQYQARMLRIHFGEGDKWQGKPLHEAIVSKCMELGMAGATVYRGIEGYGASTRIHHSSHWKFSKDAPMGLSADGHEPARIPPSREFLTQRSLRSS